MKHALVALLVAACSHAPPPAPGNAAPVTATAPASPAVTTATPAPGCYTPTPSTEIVCPPSDEDEVAIYCAHVHDPCCTTGGWTCNNDRYRAWYAEQCKH